MLIIQQLIVAISRPKSFFIWYHGRRGTARDVVVYSRDSGIGLFRTSAPNGTSRRSCCLRTLTLSPQASSLLPICGRAFKKSMPSEISCSSWLNFQRRRLERLSSTFIPSLNAESPEAAIQRPMSGPWTPKESVRQPAPQPAPQAVHRPI